MIDSLDKLSPWEGMSLVRLLCYYVYRMIIIYIKWIMEEQLIYIIMTISIVLSALCSMLEATLLSTPLSYIAGLEEQGVKGRAYKGITNFSRIAKVFYFRAKVLGNNYVGLTVFKL